MARVIAELRDVWKEYEGSMVLKGISLTVEEGSFMVIRGRSGAGKTTLLKIVGLLTKPSRGSVKLEEKEVSHLSFDELARLRLRNIGIVFQFFNLLPTLTVIENVELPLALAGVSKRERRERAMMRLEDLGIGDLAFRFPDSLSGGERQRVAIARAVVNSPKLLLADEPTSQLDDENAALVREIFLRLNREKGITVFMTTTELEGKFPGSSEYYLRGGKLHPIIGKR